jgi:hypothetical protein
MLSTFLSHFINNANLLTNIFTCSSGFMVVYFILKQI